jgi:hypothetical protein
LPTAEVIAALDTTAFVDLDQYPRYERLGAAHLQAHVRRVTGRAGLAVEPSDVEIFGVNAPARPGRSGRPSGRCKANPGVARQRGPFAALLRR